MGIFKHSAPVRHSAHRQVRSARHGHHPATSHMPANFQWRRAPQNVSVNSGRQYLQHFVWKQWPFEKFFKRTNVIIRSKHFWNKIGWFCQPEVRITVLNLLLVRCSTLLTRAQHPVPPYPSHLCHFSLLRPVPPTPCCSSSITHMAITDKKEADIDRQALWQQIRKKKSKNKNDEQEVF